MLLRKTIAAILFFISFWFFLAFFLINGIKIDFFSFSDFKISKFYIKLDKKLILQIDEIVINSKTSSSSNSFEDIKSMINKAPTILDYFHKIDINRLKIKDNEFNIRFDNELIYIDNKFVNISSAYSKNNEILNLDVYSIYLKDIDLLLLGDIKVDFKNDVLAYFGKYAYKDLLLGEINIQSNKDEMDFFINANNKIKDLKFLKQYMDLDIIAEDWMYRNVKGDIYLDYLLGKVNLNTLEPILNSIKGSARVENASVTFNKKVDSVKTELINLNYENDSLLINLKKPTFKNIDIDGSFVNIQNLTSLEHGHVDVTIMAQHTLDDNVLDILKAYDINLPLKQTSGKTFANLHLYIPYDYPMKTFGYFKSFDSNFTVNGFEFYSKNAYVDLINSDVIIKSSDFKSKDLINSRIDMKIDTNTLTSKGKADIHNLLIQSDEKKILDLKNKELEFSLNFNNNPKLFIDELKTSIEFFEDKTTVDIKSLKTIKQYSPLLQELKISNGDLNLNILENKYEFITNVFGLKLPIKKDKKDIVSLKLFGYANDDEISLNTYSKDLLFKKDQKSTQIILNGYDLVYEKDSNDSNFQDNIDIRLIKSNIIVEKDSFYSIDSKILILDDEIKFNGLYDTKDFPFTKNNNQIESMYLKGSVKDDVLKVKGSDNNFDLELKNNNLIINLNGIDLNYDSNKSNDNSFDSVSINATKSNIIINDKYKVLSDNYTMTKSDNGTSFDLVYKTGTINYFESKNKDISLKVSKINDNFINTFFTKEIMKGGTFNLDASGRVDFISGRLNFNKNRLVNLAVLNNLITLVNSSPALINPLLAAPAIFGMVTKEGFNLNGYSVNEGYIDFAYNFEDKFLNMIKIHTVGNSVDFDGYGTIDLKNSIINTQLELIFLKDYSKVISAIPALNYILLGDDKRVSSQVKITGSLEKPKIDSQIAKESLSAPVEILKRIIISPFKIFD